MYAKLFQQVLSSSLTEKESIEVRGVFFMLMAAADKSGHVLGSDETIARIINVPVDVTKRALAELMKPDHDSRNGAHDGRRLVPLERGLGYFMTGYPKYSGIRTDEERRDYFRIKKQESRARRKKDGEMVATTSVAEPVNNCKRKPEAGDHPNLPWEVSFGLRLPEPLQTENCLAAVKLWLDYKRERKESYKATGLQASLTKWGREFTAAEFPAAVETSMANQWKGIHRGDRQESRPQNGRIEEISFLDSL